MENMDTFTHSTKMGADKLAKNTPNAPIFICPSPKVWDFNEKMLHWASVVREPYSISEPYRETRSCWIMLTLVTINLRGRSG